MFAAYVLGAASACFSWHLPLAIELERLAYDLRLSIAQRPSPQDQRLLLVAFDEQTVSRTGRRSPLDRRQIASALERLDAMRPRAIGLDVIFDQPTAPADDASLVTAMRAMRTPFWLPDASGDAADLLLPAQQAVLRAFLAQALGATGHVASAVLYADSDGVMRRTASLGRPMISDALAVAAGAPPRRAELPIDYRSGTASEPVFARLSVLDLLQAPPGALARVVRGRIVLVGTELGNIDRHRTPITRFADEAANGARQNQLSGTKDLSGLEVQAQIIATLLDSPPGSSGKPLQWAFWLLVLAPPAFGIALGWLRAPALVRIVVVLAGTTALFLGSHGLERPPGVQTYGLPVVGAAVAWLFTALVANAFSAAATNAERRLAREIGARYLPPQLASQLERHPELLEVHGRRVPLAIIFTDLAGFTGLSEKLGPERLGQILNDYLDGMTEVILRHAGTLDKFIGDAVVSFWGAPLPDANPAQHALEAALALQAFASDHRHRLADEGVELGVTRIGVHYGEAVVGNFGSRRRVQYTAMGDAMNLAARLESANKQLGTEILASGEVVEAAAWTLARELGRVCVKGRIEPCRVFQLDTRLTRSDVERHARRLAGLRRGIPEPEAELAAALEPTSSDEAWALLARRSAEVGWEGVYMLDSK
jgi:adenylate cyclase